MVCSKCGGKWKDAIIYRRRMQVCSSCGFIDGRNGSCGGVEHGPDSPLLVGEYAIPITLLEHLAEWWNSKQPMFRPSKILSFIKWSWTNWSSNWEDYHREQKQLIDILRKGIKQ